MKQVWRYTLEGAGRHRVRMPIGAKILSCGKKDQHSPSGETFEKVSVWAEVDLLPESCEEGHLETNKVEHEERILLVVETGVIIQKPDEKIPPKVGGFRLEGRTDFVGTVLLSGGDYVLHVYEEIEDRKQSELESGEDLLRNAVRGDRWVHRVEGTVIHILDVDFDQVLVQVPGLGSFARPIHSIVEDFEPMGG